MSFDDPRNEFIDDETPDEDVLELMNDHDLDLDQDEAEEVRDTMEELGVDEDEAMELIEWGL